MVRLSFYHLRLNTPSTLAKLQKPGPALRNARAIQETEASNLSTKQCLGIAHGLFSSAHGCISRFLSFVLLHKIPKCARFFSVTSSLT